MNLMQSFRMALATIRINKVRSFLTMLGIIIGVTAVIALVSVMQGYNADVTQYYEKMGVNKITVSTSIYQFYDSLTLTDELVSYVQSDLGTMATGVTPTASTTGTLEYGSTTIKSTSSISFGNEQYSTCNNFVIQSGRDIAYMDIVNKNPRLRPGQLCSLEAVRARGPPSERQSPTRAFRWRSSGSTMKKTARRPPPWMT